MGNDKNNDNQSNNLDENHQSKRYSGLVFNAKSGPFGPLLSYKFNPPAWDASDPETSLLLSSYFHSIISFKYSVQEIKKIEDCARALGANDSNLDLILRNVIAAARLAMVNFSLLKDFSMADARMRQKRLTNISNKARSLLQDLEDMDLGDEHIFKFDHGRINAQILLEEPVSQRLRDDLLMLSINAEKEALAVVDHQKINKNGNLQKLDHFLFGALQTLLRADVTKIGISESGPSARYLQSVYNPVREWVLELPNPPKDRLVLLEGKTVKGVLTRWHNRLQKSKFDRKTIA